MEKTYDVALGFARNYGEAITECFVEGFAKYFDVHQHELAMHRPTTKANAVWDYVIDNLKARFRRELGFRFFEQDNATYISFREVMLMKVKKLDRNLRAANVKTRTSDAFRQQGELDFAPGTTHLYLGYVTDPLGLRINKVVLVCPTERGNYWCISLLDDTDTTVGQNVLDFPVAPAPKAPRRIRLKNEKEKGGRRSGGSV